MMAFCEEDAFQLSTHAAMRMAQRGIRGAILDFVLLHGTRRKAQRDCETYVLSDRAGRELQAAGYDGQTIAAATKIQAIVDAEGTIVTCYHRRNTRSRLSRRKSQIRGFQPA